MSGLTPTPLPAGDFRRPAIEASQRALAALGSRATIPGAFSAGVSCCLATGNDSSAIFGRVKRVSMSLLALGLVFGFAGAIPFLMDAADRNKHDPSTTAIVAGGTGLFMMLAMFFGASWWSATHAFRHLQPAGIPPAAHAFAINLEDAATYHKPKIAPEDLGRISFYPDRQCVLIEGVACSYLMFARDVRQMRAGVGTQTRFVLLEYAAGGALLDLVLTDPRLRQIVATGIHMPWFGLLAQLKRTLPFQPPAAARPAAPVSPPSPPG